MDNLLGEIDAFAVRYGDGIRNEIVDERRAHGARKAEEVHLYRCWTRGEYSGPAIGGVTHEINGNVDFHFAQQAGDFPVGLAFDIPEFVEPAHDPGTERCVLIYAPGDRDIPEMLPVAVLPNSGHCLRDGMRAEICREICDADFFVAVLLAIPKGRRRLSKFCRSPD